MKIKAHWGYLGLAMALGLTPLVLSAEEIICKGSYWSYRYKINGLACQHEAKVHTSIPSPTGLPVGHMSEPTTLTSSACWESIAKVQMDSATCCTIKDSGGSTNCEIKLIAY